MKFSTFSRLAPYSYNVSAFFSVKEIPTKAGKQMTETV